MEEFRSRSYAYGEGRMQMELYRSRNGPPPPPPPPPPTVLHDLRCYSASYAHRAPKEFELKKGKGASRSSSSSKSGWSLSDPEFKRKKRVASYKAYAMEGKVKGSLRKSFRWLKDRYTQVLYGWW